MHSLLAAANCAKGPIEANLADHLAVLATAEAGDLVGFPEMSQARRGENGGSDD